MSIADEIAKLHGLLEKGALTPAELEQAKARLWRLLFAPGLVFGGVTLFVYLVLWIFVPRENV